MFKPAVIVQPQTDVLLMTLFHAGKYSAVLLLSSAVTGSVLVGW